jgi:hypothetical protein
MSNAPRLVKRNHGGGHSYTLDGVKEPGVTSVLGTLAKPALPDWAARTAAEYAVDHWAELSEQPVSARLDAIRSAHNRRSRTAMKDGTRIHTFGAQLASGISVEVPDEYAGRAGAYARFLDEWDLAPVEVETAVAHTRYRYCGTFDAIMRSPRLGTILIDIKTGRVYAEAVLQLAAYRFADLMEGDRPMIPTDGTYVAHVLGDAVELVPVAADERQWQTFLHLLTVYRWTLAIKDESPVGRAVHPEELDHDHAAAALALD